VAVTTEPTYQALNPKHRRRSTSRRVVVEDSLLTESRRQRLAANSLDVWRNMGLLGWAIRRTLDYCCLLDFQPRTGDDGLNAELKALMTRDTEPETVDVFGRMDWDDMRRVAQSQQLLAGDAFFVQQQQRRLQMVEGAFCVDPKRTRKQGGKWVNGAKIVGGRVVRWNFREGDTKGNTGKDRSIRGSSVWQYCQFEGRPNQIRPQSPLVAAINEFRDLDETFDHMRAKVKLDQLFGIAFKRKADAEALDDDEDDGTETEVGASRVVDFGDGPAVFDLDDDEDVSAIESQHPATSTQDFLKLCLQMALKALDLPYNFFDESHTNFFGSRAAWLLFERACYARRKAQLRLHKRLTTWRLWGWVLPPEAGGTGELTLPAGMSVGDVKYRWVPRGIAWWRPQEELDTDLRSVAAGLKSMQDICDERGFGDYRENLAEIVAEREELARLGFLQQWSKNAMVQLVPTAGVSDGS
jgi:capsid protein